MADETAAEAKRRRARERRKAAQEAKKTGAPKKAATPKKAAAKAKPDPSRPVGEGIRKTTGQPKLPKCNATTQAGKPCSRGIVQDPDSLEWQETCIAHSSEDLRRRLGILDHGKGGRPKLPRVTDVLREKLEAHADEMLEKVLEIARDGHRVVVTPTGHVERVEDQSLQLKASESWLDRTLGKAASINQHSGPDEGAIVLEVPWSQDRVGLVAGVLANSGAIPEETTLGEDEEEASTDE